MCGHGTIGLAVTLAHMGRLAPGRHRFETPVGVVGVELIDAARRRSRSRELPSRRSGRGRGSGSRRRARRRRLGRQLVLPHLVRALRPCARECGSVDRGRDRHSGRASGPRRARQGRRLDRPYRVLGPARSNDANSRNFVLCPGGAYDRSPCGTGTSAKLACLHADGKLRAAKSGFRKASLAAAFARASSRVRPAAFSRASADERSSAPKARWWRTPWTRSGTGFSARPA